MNITSPILTGVARVAELPADSVTSFLRVVGAGTGLFDDSPDDGLGMDHVGAVRRRRGAGGCDHADDLFPQRLPDPARPGQARPRRLRGAGAAVFVISDMRHAALAYLGINPAKPAVKFEIRLPKAALSAVAETC
jgi:hypothetical protein